MVADSVDGSLGAIESDERFAPGWCFPTRGAHPQRRAYSLRAEGYLRLKTLTA
jgi:hypothetical protein